MRLGRQGHRQAAPPLQLFKEAYDFGQYPTAVVFDKADLLGTNALPLYRWITEAEPNPWGVSRIVFNYEKFLLDGSGQPLRRYPRKYPALLMEADVRAERHARTRTDDVCCALTHFRLRCVRGLQVQAALEGRPLPPPSASLVKAWEDAKREAIKSEYAFKPGLNYYAAGSPAS